jgi:hypothetical protein
MFVMWLCHGPLHGRTRDEFLSRRPTSYSYLSHREVYSDKIFSLLEAVISRTNVFLMHRQYRTITVPLKIDLKIRVSRGLVSDDENVLLKVTYLKKEAHFKIG